MIVCFMIPQNLGNATIDTTDDLFLRLQLGNIYKVYLKNDKQWSEDYYPELGSRQTIQFIRSSFIRVIG